MFYFLFPLLIGFVSYSASTFTAFFSARFGAHRGKLACIILRDVTGIPIWGIGYALAALTPSPRVFTSSLFISAIAWLLIIAGTAIITLGMLSLGWRAVAPLVNDTLAVTRLVSRIRHPLYSGMLLALVGLFLWFPVHNLLLACLLGALWAALQAGLEEIDLLPRLPAYR